MLITVELLFAMLAPIPAGKEKPNPATPLGKIVVRPTLFTFKNPASQPLEKPASHVTITSFKLLLITPIALCGHIGTFVLLRSSDNCFSHFSFAYFSFCNHCSLSSRFYISNLF